jgi:putative ABC transport system permease protein
VRGGTQLIAGGANWATTIYGIDGSYFIAREWDIAQGQDFNPEDLTRGAQKVLIGQTVQRNLFKEQSPLGQTIRIKNVPFEIIGIMAKKGQSAQGQDQDDAVFIPLPTARQRVLGANKANAKAVNSLIVKINEGESMDQAQDDMRQFLRQRHKLQTGDEDDFTLRNLSDIAATKEASANALALLLAAISAVSLMVGGIGIMNIMLVSVTERTKEIGLRLAIGATPKDIMLQFLSEAVMLSFIGGIIGIVLGISTAYLISAQAGWPLLIDPLIILIAVLFSGSVGIFFGLYPAMRASKLNPVEALRAN